MTMIYMWHESEALQSADCSALMASVRICHGVEDTHQSHGTVIGKVLLPAPHMKQFGQHMSV